MSLPNGSRPKVNLRSTAVKRIMQEASELGNADEDDFVAAPLESDIFEWHCTMRGVQGSEYDGGLYHLRILLPPSYPMSAPDIILLTPNGRFELGKKICIDGLTSFHAGSWQPAWGVRTAILGLRSFWMQTGEALSAVGALDYSKEERKRLAHLSRDWKCQTCGCTNLESLPEAQHHPVASGSTTAETSEDAGEVDVLSSSPENMEEDTQTTPKSPKTHNTKTEVAPDLKPESADDEDIPPVSLLAERGIIPPISLSPTTPIPASMPPHQNQPPWIDIPGPPEVSLRATSSTLPSASSGPSGPSVNDSSHNQAAEIPQPTRTIPLPPTTNEVPLAAGTPTRRATSRRPAPAWLDFLIFFLLTILIALIARRMARPSISIEYLD